MTTWKMRTNQNSKKRYTHYSVCVRMENAGCVFCAQYIEWFVWRKWVVKMISKKGLFIYLSFITQHNSEEEKKETIFLCVYVSFYTIDDDTYHRHDKYVAAWKRREKKIKLIKWKSRKKRQRKKIATFNLQTLAYTYWRSRIFFSNSICFWAGYIVLWMGVEREGEDDRDRRQSKCYMKMEKSYRRQMRMKCWNGDDVGEWLGGWNHEAKEMKKNFEEKQT